ncbi:MAG: bifunctional diguanylate cyclase/phosphodiesterase, partial [Gammaproteobacteria bacterium]|nr:bifunctional diguanylate cyclase/phosphodiesterase [Gammaproteobacteria bacterium]
MDTIGRLGGDEFALVLPNTNAEMACLVADKLLKTLDIPFDLESATCSVDASMGIAVFPYHGDDVPSLLRSADVAMYIAKRNQEGYFVYDAKKDEHTVHRLSLAADLHQALDKGELQLYYQPKLDLGSKMISGVEALMRWNHTERGFIPPDVFIPTMEQSGMIRRYTIWALDEAYRQCMEWQKAGYALSMSVNLSVYSLRDRQVLEYIQSLQEQWRPPPGALVMEVTESAVMGDLGYVSGMLSELSSQGVQFSIDDFGTGYSSLNHLKRLPVNELKIDKSFVMEMDSDADDATIVRSTVDLAHNMGLRVVAEGVETAETLDALKNLGCNQAQGYFIARPTPPDELIPSLESNGWALCRTDDKA